jgi:hypothetical protein
VPCDDPVHALCWGATGCGIDESLADRPDAGPDPHG